MAVGLGALFNNILKLGVKEGAKKSIANKLFGQPEPQGDQLLDIVEEERRQKALEFIGGGGPNYYQDPADDAPNIMLPEPLVQTPTSDIVPQQTVIPQIIEAPRSAVSRTVAGIVEEIDRINGNIAAIARAMADSAALEKKYRDEMIKDREELLAQRGKYRSQRRSTRRRATARDFFRPLRRSAARVGGGLRNLGNAALMGLGIETAAFVVKALEKFMGGGDPNTTPSAKGADDLFSAISGGEGGINSYNTGTAGSQAGYTPPSPISEMTFGDIMDAQDAGSLFAVGKYQITPDTMKGFVSGMGIKRTDVFNEANQDKFREYVVTKKRPKVGQYLAGSKKISRDEALLELAAEFASVGVPYDMKQGEYSRYDPGLGGPVPSRNIKAGESLYVGYGGNRASKNLGPDRLGPLLEKARKKGMKGAGSGAPVEPLAGSGGQRSSASFTPMSSQIAMGGGIGPKSPSVTVLDRRVGVALRGQGGGVAKSTEIPDRDPGGGGLYENYMGVA